jgi:hypothetical protein
MTNRILLLVSISILVLNEISAQKIINQKGTAVYSPTDTVSYEDWHYGGIEASDGGYVFTTRIEQYDPTVFDEREYPGLIKYDKNFKIQWHNYIKPGKFTKIAPFNGNYTTPDSTIIEGAEIHTKVIETEDGYLAFGYFYQGRKIFVFKVDKNGNTFKNYPRIFDYYSTDEYQLNDISYVNSSNFKGYIGVGQKNNHMAIFKFDEQLENITTQFLGSVNPVGPGFINISGELFGMCLLFPNGSKSRDLAKISTEEPMGIAFNGWSDNGHGYPSYSKNFNVYYGVANFSLTTVNYFQLNHYSNATSLNTKIPQFQNLQVKPDSITGLTYNFKGFDICQTQSGSLGGLELWNYMFLSGDSVLNGYKCNGIKPQGADQIIAGDIYVRELKFDTSNLTLDTFISGTTQKINNYGHSSGADYYPRIAIDLDDNFIVLTNNTDSFSQVTNHYYLQKINRFTNAIDWRAKEMGTGPSGICPFELIVTSKGRYITAGNNYDTLFNKGTKNEDLDIVLWGSACQENAIKNATEFLPNLANGHDFSVQQWSITTPGNPKTLQIGAQGVVGSRIIVEPGFTLKFLGGQGVHLQFPHVDEFGKGIMQSNEPLKNIVVYPNGKIILENGVILSGLNDCHSSWEGIELMQSGIGLPKAEIIMGSTEIKDAITAITANKNAKISVGSSAGNYARFTNCQTGIAMINDDFSNSSKIIKTIFDYHQPVEIGFNDSLNNHIYLNNIHGLRIWGTQFINSYDSSIINGKHRGTGIKSINSNFNVLRNQSNVSNIEECEPPSSIEPPCLFRKLSAGIDAVYLTPSYFVGYPIKILDNQFENCRHAMHFANGNNIIVYKNNILIDSSNQGIEPIFQLGSSYGITMNGCSQFQIIQNTITINDLNRFTHGIVINNSDYLNNHDPSLIYKNTTDAAAYQPDKNIALSVFEASSNLKINCNTNTNVSTDWYFNQSTNITEIGSQNMESGNKFAKESPCPALNDAKDWYFGENIDYYLFTSVCGSNTRSKPLEQAISGIFPLPIVTRTFPNNMNLCPDSSSCHISRWTKEMAIAYSGSFVILPPLPPPNKEMDNSKFLEEQDRIEKEIPLKSPKALEHYLGGSPEQSINHPKNSNVQLFPNPISTENPYLSISNFEITNASLKVFNIKGQEIPFECIDNHKIRLNKIREGLYFARVNLNNDVISLKFIITQ